MVEGEEKTSGKVVRKGQVLGVKVTPLNERVQTLPFLTLKTYFTHSADDSKLQMTISSDLELCCSGTTNHPNFEEQLL